MKPRLEQCCRLGNFAHNIGLYSRIIGDRGGIVSSLDEIKNLLVGTVNPENLEDNPELLEEIEKEIVDALKKINE